MQGRRQEPGNLSRRPHGATQRSAVVPRHHGSTRLAKRSLHLSADITCRVGAENRGDSNRRPSRAAGEARPPFERRRRR